MGNSAAQIAAAATVQMTMEIPAETCFSRGTRVNSVLKVMARITAALALVLSCLFTWVPVLNTVSAGISIVICTVAAAAVCAWLFPIPDEEVDQ